MKNKSRRIKMIIAGICSVMLISCAVIFAGAQGGWINFYESLSDEDFSKKLSDQSASEMFDEINALSEEGVEYPDLIDFAFSLYEKIDSVSESLLVKTIVNKKLHPNLRMLCVELLEVKLEDDEGNIQLSDKNAEKLGALLLDEGENSSVRFSLIETLPENESTADILETISFSKDEQLAARALRFLNFFAPERARPIAEDFIKSGENVGLGISTINYQISHSDDEAEKDEWVAYLVGLLDEVKDTSMEDESIKNTLISCLEQLRYPTSLYAIINYEYVDNEYKSYVVGEKKAAVPAFLEVLEGSPTDYDIEMIMKAIDLNPLNTAELVGPLKIAIEKSEKDYEISGLVERVNAAVAAEEQERLEMYGEDE